jgi:hypothetical protein
MTSEELQTLERVMLLATTARDRFDSTMNAGQQLTRTDDAQKVIIGDLAESIPDIDNLQKSLSDADAEIASLDAELGVIQRNLLALLNEGSSAAKRPTDILKALLGSFQSVLLDLAKGSAEKGQSTVPFLDLVQLEDQIANTIDNLSERGLYPEADQETSARLQRREAHAQKLVEFLSVLKQRLSDWNQTA